MATVRIATTEVQVDDIIYTFSSTDRADAFEACVATVDLSHCETDHTPVGRRPADKVSQIDFTQEAALAEDGGINFNAIVDGKPVQCKISQAALEQHFGAQPASDPLTAYTRDRERIHALAERKLRKQPQQRVLIEAQDIG